MRSVAALALIALVPAVLPTAVGAEERALRGLPHNAPARCPYCGGDETLMKASGVVSHGGFEFGSTDTAEIDKSYPTADILWVETEHVEMGLAIAARKIGNSNRARIAEELTRLSAALPEVNPRARILDPWLRVHLYAQRVEETYARFVEIFQLEKVKFPDGKKPWNMLGTYLGEGPYVGQKGKYEFMIWPSEPVHSAFLKEHFGLRVRTSQRWHIKQRGTLISVIHIGEGRLRDDAVLHNHVAFNLAHNMLDGYKHYSYDIPTWLHLGVAHWIEREIDPRYNSFDASEGAIANRSNKSDWKAESKKLLSQKKLPRLAELMGLRTYADASLADNFASWSAIAFLLETHPDGLVCLVSGLKGVMTREGYPDGSNMAERHRKLIRSCLDWSYAEFDAALAAWLSRATQE